MFWESAAATVLCIRYLQALFIYESENRPFLTLLSTQVYVTNAGSYSVSVIDTSTNVVTPVPVGAHPVGVSITPGRHPCLRDKCRLELGFGDRHNGPPAQGDSHRRSGS
jgi:YVTN family beta-propeller protein